MKKNYLDPTRIARSIGGLGLIAMILVTAACSTGQPTQAINVEATIAAGIVATQAAAPTKAPATVAPTPTPPAAPTAMPTTAATAAPGSIKATVSVETINLRTNPSTVHPVAGTCAQGTVVTVLGKALGDEWVYVQTTDGRLGWMAVTFLSEIKLDSVPLKKADDCLVIPGKVVDTQGVPIDLINIAVTQGQLRTDAHSGPDGAYYLYLPKTSQGTWNVEVVGVGCKSRIVDANCNYTGVFVPPMVAVTLPAMELTVFTYDLNKSSVANQATIIVESTYLFNTLGTLYHSVGTTSYPRGTIVTVLGKASGDDWVYVKAPDGTAGWLSVASLNKIAMVNLPIKQPDDTQVVFGKVVDTQGASVNQVNINVSQGMARVAAHSGEDGIFYAYLSTRDSGTWNVEAVSVNCASRIVDANCKYAGEFIASLVPVTVPSSRPVVITYDPNKTHITRGTATLEDMETKLSQAITKRDYEALKLLMQNPFIDIDWYPMTANTLFGSPTEITQRWSSVSTPLTFDQVVPTATVQKLAPMKFDPRVSPVAAMYYSTGWYANEKGQAVLYIVKAPDGQYYFAQAIIARDGFGQ